MLPKPLARIFNAEPEDNLYHYTNSIGLKGIAENCEIWATHTQYLNDTTEFHHSKKIVKEEIEFRLAGSPLTEEIIIYEDMIHSLENAERVNVCVASFSEAPDQLSQWRGYCPGSGGYSIGFSPQFLIEAAARKGWFLSRCIYNINEQKSVINDFISEVMIQIKEHREYPNEELEEFLRDRPSGNFLAYFMLIAPIFKDPTFAEEKEWRLISRAMSCRVERFEYRPGTFYLIPYYRFPLIDNNEHFRIKEIYIGPNPHPLRAEMALRSFLLKECPSPEQTILYHSKVPFQNW